MIILHSKRGQMAVLEHTTREDIVDSPELVGIRDINDILDILSGVQLPLDEERPEGGGHNGCDQRDQNGGLEEAGHIVDSWEFNERKSSGGAGRRGTKHRRKAAQTRKGFICGS